MTKVFEHSAPTYPPRTHHNARSADLTVAFALRFDTPGEKLTQRAAGEKYLAIPLEATPVSAARMIYRCLRDRKLERPVINIAGNGIYTLAPAGWSQDSLNAHLLMTLGLVHQHWPIAKIISGGQTGVDLAGVTVADILGIESEATLPKGFLQRTLDVHEKKQTADDILAQIEAGKAALKAILESHPEMNKAGLSETRPTENENRASAEPPEPQSAAMGHVRVVSKRQGGRRAEADETVIDGDRNNPVFGNRHYLRNWKDPEERAQVIERHRIEDFEPDVLAGGPMFQAMSKIAERLRAGQNIALSCWCAPLNCHCDHIADGIRMLAAGEDLKDKVRADIAERKGAKRTDAMRQSTRP